MPITPSKSLFQNFWLVNVITISILPDYAYGVNSIADILLISCLTSQMWLSTAIVATISVCVISRITGFTSLITMACIDITESSTAGNVPP